MRRLFSLPALLLLTSAALAQQMLPPPSGPGTAPPIDGSGPPTDGSGPPPPDAAGAPPPSEGGGPPPGNDAHPPGAGPRTPFLERFEAANTTHDGKLTLEQARAGHLIGIAKFFSQIDSDHKGYVTIQDVHAWMIAMHAARTGRAPQQ